MVLPHITLKTLRGHVFSKGDFNKENHFYCRDSCNCDQPHALICTPDASATVGPIKLGLLGMFHRRIVPYTLPSFPCWSTTEASACLLVRPKKL